MINHPFTNSIMIIYNILQYNLIIVVDKNIVVNVSKSFPFYQIFKQKKKVAFC